MKRLSNDEVSTLTRELAYLLHAGMGNADALTLMAEDGGKHAALLKSMAESADEGASLSQAFEKTGVFPEYAAKLLDVGDQSGRTEETLNALADYYEGRERLGRQLRTSLLYPVILLLIMLAVIVVLLVRVLPIFNDVYAQFGVTLTGVAGVLLKIGNFLRAIMPVLFALLGVIAVCCLVLAVSDQARTWAVGLWRKRRGDRGVSRQVNDARFALALSMGLKSGMPIEEALNLSGQILSDVPSAKARVDQCVAELEDGKPLHEALENAALMPKAECRLLAAGLRSGVGDQAMDQITKRMNERSETAIHEKVSRVEPTLVIIASLLVGLILLTVMLPLMNIMSAIG